MAPSGKWHFMNEGQLVQAVMHIGNTQKSTWPWSLTYDFDIQQASRGYQGTCSCCVHQTK